MTFGVFRHHTKLGTVTATAAGCTADGTRELHGFLAHALEEGLRRRAEVQTADGWRIGTVPVATTDPHAGEALARWFAAHDFTVRREHPETDKELRELLDRLPDEGEAVERKRAVVADLHDATHLEKTFLLRTLRAYCARMSG